MAKKRKTRKQKIQSTQRKREVVKKKIKTDNKVKTDDNDILIVDEKYIKSDILKTVIISLFFTLILLGIWWWLK